MRLLIALTITAAAPCALGAITADVQILGTTFEADRPFPQFMHVWSEGWAIRGPDGEPLRHARENMPLGAYVHVSLRNNGEAPLVLDDVQFEGVSLQRAIAFSQQTVSGLHPASVHFSELNAREKRRLERAGEPVWWKADPSVVAAQSCAEVVIRLRRMPAVSDLTIGLPGAHESKVTIHVDSAEARFASVSFSPDFESITAYVQRSGGAPPVRILLDGQDITSRTDVHFDPALDMAVLSIMPPESLPAGSFHVFEARYADGKVARAGLRAFAGDFVYGMWGYTKEGGETPRQRADYFLSDMRRHHINALMFSIGKDVMEYLETDEGVVYRREQGLKVMATSPGSGPDPLCLFLTDEPDAHDYAVKDLEHHQRLGALGQSLVRRSGQWRAAGPAVPHLLNVDNTYKPENWYMYARIADVYCADPYYQEQQRIVWNQRPVWAWAFTKPTYVLGVTTICQWACAPRPLHIILNCVRHDVADSPFRFATPAEKRLEVFYALAAGAKAFSYWWYTPYGEFHGCGSSDPAGVALWREIGLLGALARTAGPLLVQSCPAELAVKAPPRLMVRTLLAGRDAVLVLVMNEQVASDRQGTVVVPVEKPRLSVTVPAWLKPGDAFEISEHGVSDVSWTPDGGDIRLEPESIQIARMFVIAPSELRTSIQKRYQESFAPTARDLLKSAQP
jgi:hypothetical protein